MHKSLAGTKKMYHEVAPNSGLRARLKGDGCTVRIHVKKDAKSIDSRERMEYWAIDVDYEALAELVDLLAKGSESEVLLKALQKIADVIDEVGDII